MNNSKKEKLNKLVAKGIWHYVLVYGVLLWGVTTAILFSIFWHFFGLSSFGSVILPSLIQFPLGGVIFGLLMWYIMKWQYKKSLNDES